MKKLLTVLMLMLSTSAYAANVSPVPVAAQDTCQGVVVTSEEADGLGRMLVALTAAIGDAKLGSSYSAYVAEHWPNLNEEGLLIAYRSGVIALAARIQTKEPGCLAVTKLEGAALGFIYTTMTDFLTTKSLSNSVLKYASAANRANSVLAIAKLQKYMW